jgi:hypothetical protein
MSKISMHTEDPVCHTHTRTHTQTSQQLNSQNKVRSVTTSYGTSNAQEDMVVLRLAVWKKSAFVTREPSKLAKQPNNRKTVAHIINPRENHTICPCHWLSMTGERTNGYTTYCPICTGCNVRCRVLGSWAINRKELFLLATKVWRGINKEHQVIIYTGTQAWARSAC